MAQDDAAEPGQDSGAGASPTPAAVTPSPVPWLEASLADLEACDLDAPIAGAAADWHSLSDRYNAAARQEGQDPAAARAYRLLGGLLSMMLRPRDPAAPFEPMLVWADGRRSAALSDFRPAVEIIAHIPRLTRHPALTSRAADVAWTLERRRHDMGLAALEAYLQLLDDVAAGKMKFDHQAQQETGRLGVGVLRRCVTIARSRSFGDKAPDLAPIAARIEALRQDALSAKKAMAHLTIARLQLDFGLQEPAILAADIEASVEGLDPVADGHLITDVLKAAASAYFRAKDEARAHAVKQRISDVFVTMADNLSGSSMLASGLLADAISALAGLKDAKEARKALRHRLIDAQAGIADEMGSFSHPIDLDDLRADIAKQVEGQTFYDLLFYVALLAQPSDPVKAREQAEEAAKEFPLSSLFGASIHDREGKVRHVVEAGGLGQSSHERSLEPQIARHEGLKRNIDVALIDVARRGLNAITYIAPDVLLPLLAYSPFVPEGKEHTFAAGLSSFLRGEAISALYILTPLVEAGLRACLKANGFEVTTFDDASQTQEDKTISALYRDQRSDLEAVFGPNLTFTIEQVFLAPAGPTLRHGVAHGLLRDGDATSPDAFYACWLVLHLCLKPLYPHRDQLGLPELGV